MLNRFKLSIGIIICLFFFGCSGAEIALLELSPSTVLWKGEWKSTRYRSVFGDITLRLPKEMPSEIEFKVPVSIGFSKDNSYQPGEAYAAYYRGKLKKNIATGLGNAVSPISEKDVQILGLKQYPGIYILIENFTLKFNKTMDTGEGTWSSTDADYGTFSLSKIGV